MWEEAYNCIFIGISKGKQAFGEQVPSGIYATAGISEAICLFKAMYEKALSYID
jgi:hypothetical protein